MSDPDYINIQNAWEDEQDDSALKDLEDLRLSKMAEALSRVRLQLAETPSEKEIEAEILTQQALNMEYMLKDLLHMRRNKIISDVLRGETPSGIMTLSEEEFYNRLSRAFTSHTEFTEEVLTGTPPPTLRKEDPPKKKKTKDKKKSEKEPDDGLQYIMVRFTREVEEEFVGMDEIVYGPFGKEDIATIPTANARIWLRNGTAVRVIADDIEREDDNEE